MRLLTSWIVAFVLALPRPALAQSIKPADIVGTWVFTRDGQEWSDSLKGQLLVTYLTINPNGTFAYEGKNKKNDGELRPWGVGWSKGSWSLAADTLLFKDEKRPAISYKVVLKNGQLLLWVWLMWDTGRRVDVCAEKVFEHFDPSKPLPLPPKITIKPEDLFGTWAGTAQTKYWGTVTDTFVIGADHGLFVADHGWPDLSTHYHWDTVPGEKYTGTWPGYFSGSSQWELLPGDEFTGALYLGRFKIALQNGELIPCSPARPVFKRVKP
jgi:hypothetical protein